MSWVAGQGRCVLCGEEKNRVFYHSAAGGTICHPCYKRELQPRKRCVLCGEWKASSVRVSDDEGICGQCFRDKVNVRPCGMCGRRGPVWARGASGEPICLSCYNRRHAGECALCGVVRRVHSRTEDGRPVCLECHYSKVHPAWSCAGCGRTRRERPYRDRRGRVVCVACYMATTRTPERCTACGRVAPAYGRSVPSRGALCRTCAARSRPAETCAVCGEERRSVMRQPDGGAVCNRCYQGRVKPKERCAECGRVQPVHVRRGDGGAMCNSCVTWLRKHGGQPDERARSQRRVTVDQPRVR